MGEIITGAIIILFFVLYFIGIILEAIKTYLKIKLHYMEKDEEKYLRVPIKKINNDYKITALSKDCSLLELSINDNYNNIAYNLLGKINRN
jgi:hypothetical protein